MGREAVGLTYLEAGVVRILAAVASVDAGGLVSTGPCSVASSRPSRGLFEGIRPLKIASFVNPVDEQGADVCDFEILETRLTGCSTQSNCFGSPTDGNDHSPVALAEERLVEPSGESRGIGLCRSELGWADTAMKNTGVAKMIRSAWSIRQNRLIIILTWHQPAAEQA
jgi:hypothetical protein